MDGTWELNITVTDLAVDKTLRVSGDLHMGGVMVKLVEALDFAMDWSDHALWWPLKNMWLSHPRTTLDQYGVGADSKLLFTPMHKVMKVQIPDLQILELRMDFSCKVFSAVVQLCKELGIRHPEEMSVMKYMDKDDLKKNIKETLNQKKKKQASTENLGVNGNGLYHSPSGSIERLSPYSRSPAGPSPTNTLGRTPAYNAASPYNTLNANGTLSPGSMYSLSFESAMENSLANSPQISVKDAAQYLQKHKNLVEKARVNYAWLDSSKSLMEQGVKENDFVVVRFKYFSFYDLNPKYDAIRINQLYEQAKWSLLSEDVECTEEEMMMFAAIQLQVQMQAGQPQLNDSMMDSSTVSNHLHSDDIDADLTNLEESLDSTVLSTGDITSIPELSGYVRYFKPKKLTLKSYKKAFCKCKDTHIAFYKSEEEANSTPAMKINIKGCEAHPDLNLSSQKYGIKLFVPGQDGMSEIWLRFDSEEQYCKWMAACKMASQGKTMADSSYATEVESLRTLLSRQQPSQAPAPVTLQFDVNVNAEDFVAPRYHKRIKNKTLVQRIMDAHANVQNLNLIDSKMAYIKAWQALPDFGITYFVIKQKNSKKEELLGVAYNRIMRVDANTGDAIKTWRYNTLKSWHVNWEIRHVNLEFEEETLTFSCLSSSCKTVHEFIGGYIFLSMRSSDKNQTLNEELFLKLTGGWN